MFRGLSIFNAGTRLKLDHIRPIDEPVAERLKFTECIDQTRRLATAECATTTGRAASTSLEDTEVDTSGEGQSDSLHTDQATAKSEHLAGTQETPTDRKDPSLKSSVARITFAAAANKPASDSKALYIPPPRARDNGKSAFYLSGNNVNLFNRTPIY